MYILIKRSKKTLSLTYFLRIVKAISLIPDVLIITELLRYYIKANKTNVGFLVVERLYFLNVNCY